MTPTNPFQSTVFRIAVVSALLLGALALGVAWTVGSAANAILTHAVEEAIQADAAELRAEFTRGGMTVLADAVSERSRQPSGGLYYLADASLQKRAGNLVERPETFRGSARAGIFTYQLPGQAAPNTAAGLHVALDGGGSLIIARDIEAQRTLLQSLYRHLGFGLLVLLLAGAGGGYLLARHILRRIDGMRRASETIMAGSLNERLPLAGSGDELDRLASQLNAMLERIESLMGSLREVSDNIAHDLKTPLNRLRNSAEAALSDARGSPAWREGLERTIDEADDLIKTFNSLLLIARLEAGAVEQSFESVDLAVLVRDVAELYEPVAEEAGFAVHAKVCESLPIRANRQLIGQALSNLIENAIKYGVQSSGALPGSIRSSIAVEAIAAGDNATVTVADSGPGISPGDRQRALKRFVRLEASRSRPGSGLGLSLVTAVVQLHHGTIRLEDNAPGLRVVMMFPLARDKQAMASSASQQAVALQSVGKM